MAIKVTQPEINLREVLKDLDKPSGVAGEAMLRANTPQEQLALIGAGPNRNLIINGNFSVWQRGTSGTSGYVADRWKGLNCTSQSKQYDATVGNYLQFTATNAAVMYYGIELDETGQVSPFEVGATYTISLKVKSEAKMYKPNVSFRDSLASGTNTVFTSVEIKPHQGSGEWEDVVYQFTVDSAPHGTAPLFELTLVSFEFASTPINIAQVQMVKGTVATPFQQRLLAEELALCKRYYQQIGFESGAPFRITGSGNGSNTMLTGFMFEQEMREAPDINYFGGGVDGGNFNVYVDGSSVGNTAPSSAQIGTRSVRWNFAGTSSFPNSAYWIDVGPGSNQLALTLDAEF